MIAIKYGGAMVALPLVHAPLRNDVRRNYRDRRRTHDRYDARAYATLTALWYTATTHPRVTVRPLW